MSAPAGRSEQLKPLQLLRELRNTRTSSFAERLIKYDIISRTGSLLTRGFGRAVKPLLRFEGLLSYQQRLGIELIAAPSMTANVLWALSPSAWAVRKYLMNVLVKPEKRTRPLVWLEWCLQTDLIYAFDAQPFCTESLSVLLLFLRPDAVSEMIDTAEQAGSPAEYCSGAKNAVGGYLARQLPEPDCIVTSSHPCDSMVSSYQTLEYLSGAPCYRLDTPYWEDERALDYYTDQVRELIAFLEKHLDRRLDYDRLRQVLGEVNRTNELLMEINEMLRARPCPGAVAPTIITWAVRVLGMGTPEVTEMARRLHGITRARLQAGRGPIKKERIRVIWFDVPVAFYPLVLWMEETFGAVTVMDLISFIDTPAVDTSTPESMIRGLAIANMNLCMPRQFHGPVELFHRDLERVCEQYDGDCFIYAGHAGCKHGWASVRLLKEYMKKIGMPLLVLSTDIFDRRVTHEDQLKEQIEQFLASNGLI